MEDEATSVPVDEGQLEAATEPAEGESTEGESVEGAPEQGLEAIGLASSEAEQAADATDAAISGDEPEAGAQETEKPADGE